MKNLILAFKIWLIILPLAFVNGAIRIFLINPSVGEKAGQTISVLMLSIAVIFVVSIILRRSKTDYNKNDLLMTGLLLVILSVVFEFGFGRATGDSWESMLASYDVFKGQMWPLVLLTELFSPAIIDYFRNKKCVPDESQQ